MCISAYTIFFVSICEESEWISYVYLCIKKLFCNLFLKLSIFYVFYLIYLFSSIKYFT